MLEPHRGLSSDTKVFVSIFHNLCSYITLYSDPYSPQCAGTCHSHLLYFGPSITNQSSGQITILLAIRKYDSEAQRHSTWQFVGWKRCRKPCSNMPRQYLTALTPDLFHTLNLSDPNLGVVRQRHRRDKEI